MKKETKAKASPAKGSAGTMNATPGQWPPDDCAFGDFPRDPGIWFGYPMPPAMSAALRAILSNPPSCAQLMHYLRKDGERDTLRSWAGNYLVSERWHELGLTADIGTYGENIPGKPLAYILTQRIGDPVQLINAIIRQVVRDMRDYALQAHAPANGDAKAETIEPQAPAMAGAMATATAKAMPCKTGRPRAGGGNEVTQDEAAEKYEVDKRTIQNWEAGKGTPEGYPGRRSRYKLEEHAYDYKGRIKAGEQRARELAASQQYEIQSGQ